MKHSIIWFSFVILWHNACVESVAEQSRIKENVNDKWEEWKNEHNKNYNGDIDIEKRSTWIHNHQYVESHNAKDTDFKLSVGPLADMDITEYNAKKEMLVQRRQCNKLSFRGHSVWKKVPKSWDWRTRGVVGPVYNQGRLGDVLAITATECVESYGTIKTGRLVSLSMTETHDCCTKHQPVTDVWGCIHKLGGLCTEADYPSPGNNTCHSKSCTPAVQIKGSRTVIRGNETDLQMAVLVTPVQVYIDASRRSFQLYKSGIYSDPACSRRLLDDALQLVGYGTAGGKDYWICKNSWGVNWGMKGYILIARNQGNMCGIATEASYPI